MERFLPERGLLRQVTVLRSAQLHLQTDAAAERKWLQSLNLPASGLPSVAGWCGKGTQAGCAKPSGVNRRSAMMFGAPAEEERTQLLLQYLELAFLHRNLIL